MLAVEWVCFINKILGRQIIQMITCCKIMTSITCIHASVSNYNHNHFECYTNFSKSWEPVNKLSAYSIIKSSPGTNPVGYLLKNLIFAHVITRTIYRRSLMFCQNVYPPRTSNKSIMFADIALSHKENEPTKSLNIHNTKWRFMTKTNLYFLQNSLLFCSITWNEGKFG